MWVPTDDGFLAAQAQEALALARADIARSPAPSVPAAAAAALATVTDSDADVAAMAALGAAVLLFWLVLCGICRCYVCVPCPCCFCYIPCCAGFCLPKERTAHANQHHHYHQYPGASHSHPRQALSAKLPAYDNSRVVDLEQPLLEGPAYMGPPTSNALPPAYHNVPTAPPLSPP